MQLKEVSCNLKGPRSSYRAPRFPFTGPSVPLTGAIGSPYRSPFLLSNCRSLPVFYLVDVSDIFYFFCTGEQKGEFEAPGGGRGGDLY